jgi:hypothetical protein
MNPAEAEIMMTDEIGPLESGNRPETPRPAQTDDTTKKEQVNAPGNRRSPPGRGPLFGQ